MDTHKAKLLIAISTGLLVVISAVALTKPGKTDHSSPKSSQEKQQPDDTLPLIISNVKDIEIVKATLKYKGTPDIVVVLEIKNKSDKAIVAVSVETGAPEEANGITVEGFKKDGEPPSVIIDPHGSKIVDFPLNNVKLGDPIRISGVVYIDDSEDGEKRALETIHIQREMHKSGKAKLKGEPSPQ